MIKRVEIFALAEGKDPGQAWKYLTEIRALAIAGSMPELRKFVLSRAVEPWPERVGEMGGPPRWWCISEMCFDDRESCLNALAGMDGIRDSEWDAFVGEDLGSAIVEENYIINEAVPEKHCKRLGIFRLKQGADPEEAWKYWVTIHAENWRTTSPGCSLYKIARAAETPWGAPDWWGFLEQRFDSIQAVESCMHHPRPKDDFMELYMSGLTGGIGYCEEKTIVSGR